MERTGGVAVDGGKGVVYGEHLTRKVRGNFYGGGDGEIEIT